MIRRSSPEAIAGVVVDDDRPLSNREVLFQLGDDVFSVRSDSLGRFRVPVGGLGEGGDGWIFVDETMQPVAYEGRPLRDLAVRVPR